MLSSFLAQFYDDKPCPRTILLSQKVEEQELLAGGAGDQAPGTRCRCRVPKRGEKKDLTDHALQNAREALARRLAGDLDPEAACSKG